MNERLLARRYTNALIGSGTSVIGLQDLETTISLVSAIVDDTTLYPVLNSPSLSTDKKIALVKAIIQTTSSSPVVLNFFSVLIEKKRSTLLPFIKTELIQQLARLKNVTDVDVYIPRDAGDDVKNAIIAQLKRFVPKDLNCNFILDESLIGGYKAVIGNTIYDGSIKTVLQKLKQNMLVKC